jgi:hypothetical protein
VTPQPNLALIGFTGSRSWPDPQLLEDTLLDVWHDALQIGYDGIEVIHGDADGADTITDTWAERHGVPRRRRPADWDGPCATNCPPAHRRTNRRGMEFCPLAGHRRNQQIVDERPVMFVAAATRCAAPRCASKAPHDSHGTADCMRRAKAAGIPVHRITA